MLLRNDYLDAPAARGGLTQPVFDSKCHNHHNRTVQYREASTPLHC